MTSPDSPDARPPFSANADWVRALQRTAAITPASSRTLAVAIDETARANGARTALVGDGETLTYTTLAARGEHYARWARLIGLGKGDRVALMLENQPDYASIWIGLSKIGVVVALLNTQLVGDTLAHCLALARSRHLIVGIRYAAVVADLGCDATCWVHGGAHPIGTRIDTFDTAAPETSVSDQDITLADPALLIYTSGTTGRPKAAHVSHYRIMMWSEWFAGMMNVTPEDRLYDCLPMCHSVGGVVAIGAMLVASAAVITRDGFSARRFWPDVTESGATIFQYIGELCRYLVTAAPHEQERAHSLRLCVGNGLRADIWQRFMERFAIPRVIEFYAATEGSFSLFNLEGRVGAIGRIPPFMAHRSPVAIVRFDDLTELPVRGDDGFCIRCEPNESGEAIGMIADDTSGLATRFEGYTNAAETSRKVLRDVFKAGDMWFRTGDLMRRDKAGFFYFVDRIGDTFRWKGENVAASEVADVVAACPGVLDAVVYGVSVPNADGRAGMAAIVPGADFDLVQLHAHLIARLPKYARPLFLRLGTAMQTTATFKPKKQDLVHAGFEPTRVGGDRLYIDDPETGRFVPLDADRHDRIVSGEMRL